MEEIKLEHFSDEEADQSNKFNTPLEPKEEEFVTLSDSNQVKSIDHCADVSLGTSNEGINHQIPTIEYSKPNEPLHMETMENIDPKNNWLFTKLLESNVIRLCPICDVKFDNVWNWQEHLGSFHKLFSRENLNLNYLNSNRAECKDCGKIVVSTGITGFLAHAITHMPNKNYLKCKLCCWCTSTRVLLGNHLENKHPKFILQAKKEAESRQCPYCLQRFTRVAKMRNHMRSAHRRHIDDKAILICPICDIEIQTKLNLRCHFAKEHHTFSVADYNFEKLSDLDKGSPKPSTYKCKSCATTFQHSTKVFFQMWTHSFNHTRQYSYKCKYCDKQFFGSIVMWNHACAKLREAYMLNPASPAHTRRKKGEEKMKNSSNLVYVCPVCGADFPFEYKLLEHGVSFHESTQSVSVNLYKPFKCKICDKKFETKDICREHECIRTYANHHTNCKNSPELRDNIDETPQDDPQTIAKAAESSNQGRVSDAELEKYIDIFCPRCGNKKFETTNELMSHLREVHNFCNNDYVIFENGSSICKLCHKYFKEFVNSDLIKHTLTHLMWCFYCKYCDVKETNFVRMKNHVKQKHISKILNSYSSYSGSRYYTKVDKSFICKICEYPSESFKLFTKHREKEHFTAGIYKCPLCPELLTFDYDRRIHIHKQHFISELPKATCNVCFFTAQNENALSEHLMVHDLRLNCENSHSSGLSQIGNNVATGANAETGIDQDILMDNKSIIEIKVEEPQYNEFIDETV